MSRIKGGERKIRALELFIRFLARLPGLGFLEQYALQMRNAADKVDGVRNQVAAQKDDFEDAKDAWDDFKR